MLAESVKRGDVYYADLNPALGSEQGGLRPVLVVQNNVGNKHSPTVIGIAITSQTCKTKIPTHIELSAKKYGFEKNSVALAEQVRTIDKRRLKEKICHLDKSIMEKINIAMMISLGLYTNSYSRET